MSKVFYAVCLVFLSGLFISCSKDDININEPIPESSIDSQKLLELVNKVRSEGITCGSTYYPPVKSLVWNDKLATASTKHSQDMNDNDFLDHTSSNEDSFLTRITNAGYNYSSAGENIAMGYSSEEAVIDGWLTSQEHCANIMNDSYTEMGAGRVGDYWTQDFGQPITVHESSIDSQKLLELVNKVRSEGITCGSTYYPPVKSLVWNDKLATASTKHSQDMNDNDFLDHTSSNGDSFLTRITNAGYNYSSAGENIAMGYSSEEAVMDGWLTSQGHCANIMNDSYSEMGAGRVGDYWTQDFGHPIE